MIKMYRQFLWFYETHSQPHFIYNFIIIVLTNRMKFFGDLLWKEITYATLRISHKTLQF